MKRASQGSRITYLQGVLGPPSCQAVLRLGAVWAWQTWSRGAGAPGLGAPGVR